MTCDAGEGPSIMRKTERHRLIETLVEQREVGTQREIVAALRPLGCHVTQATVSRDIRELDLQKVHTPLGRTRYVPSEHGRPRPPEEAARSVLRDFARSVVVVESFVVVRCEIGTASVVARQIDNLHHGDVIGSLAGNDTVLVITAAAERAHIVGRYFDRLREA